MLVDMGREAGGREISRELVIVHCRVGVFTVADTSTAGLTGASATFIAGVASGVG